MAFQKVEFEFPDEQEEESTEIEIEPSGEIEVDISGKEPVVEAVVDPDPDPEAEIEIVDDTPEKDRNRVPSEPPEEVTDEELATYNKNVQNRIKHFSKGYHDERRAKETAQRERDELERVVQKILSENDDLKSTVNKGRETMLAQAKSNLETELSQARATYKTAHEQGDTEALLAAQEALTNANLKKDNLKKLEQDANNDTVGQQNTTRETVRPQPDPKAVAWKEQNTWFGAAQYQPQTAFALGVHKELTEVENISADSDEYYEKLNIRMRKTFPELFGGTNEQEVQVPKPKASNVVAPATRSTAPKKVRLTATQVALSKRLGITPAQYAQQLQTDMRNKNG